MLTTRRTTTRTLGDDGRTKWVLVVLAVVIMIDDAVDDKDDDEND
jgi:hypothetical protein